MKAGSTGTSALSRPDIYEQDQRRANRNEFLDKLQRGLPIAPGTKPNYVKQGALNFSPPKAGSTLGRLHRPIKSLMSTHDFADYGSPIPDITHNVKTVKSVNNTFGIGTP